MNLFSKKMDEDVDIGTPVPSEVVDDVVDDKPIESAWPDNWRELYAGDDEKKMAHLSRYASPQAALDGLIATKTKLSSGEYKSTAPFPEKGTEEEKQAWREQNGIPNSVDGYEYSGLSDEDKEFAKNFSDFALTNNIPKDQAGAFMEYMVNLEKAESDALERSDAEAKQSAEDKLHVEWGNEYRRNINIINGLLDTAPEGVKDRILGGRLADGTPLGSDPETLRFLADVALKVNPVSTVVPVGGDPSKGIDDEIGNIEQLMKENSPKYWKDEKVQARLRDLYEARDRFKKAG